MTAVPRLRTAEQAPGWDRPADLEKDPALIPDPATTPVPAELRKTIEDAMALGRAFAAAGTFEEAFGIYENARKERANGVQLASRQQADEVQGATERGPNPGTGAELRGLYSYNPVTVPLAPAGAASLVLGVV